MVGGLPPLLLLQTAVWMKVMQRALGLGFIVEP